jgi:predicted transposase YbfD/YdcC
MPNFSLLDLFENIEDPRVSRTRRHKLTDILVIALMGTLGGNSGWDDMFDYAKFHEQELRRILELPNGIPSADTIRRVITSLNVTALGKVLTAWAEAMRPLAAATPHIAIDGKTVRGSFEGTEGKGALHLVHAWACEEQLLLGQYACDVKSNEITAIPELLAMLNLKKAIVTIDAMGCQTEIAKSIVDGGGDYVFGLKGNHKTLHEDVLDAFDSETCEALRKEEKNFFEQNDKGHGRIEQRRVYCLRDIAWVWKADNWANLKTVVLVEAQTSRLGKLCFERRVYISSLNVNAERFCNVIREHWHVENKLHWTLDVTFREDNARTAKSRGTLAMATLRRIALGMLRAVTTDKPRSLAAKKRITNWGFKHMLEALTSGFRAN